MEFASDYCAIKGGPCNRTALFKEVANSVFMAYPFQPEFQAIAASFSELLNRQNQKDFSPSPTSASSGYLFCDVICPLLLKAEIMIGEISVPNRNVTLELGYSLGCGKPTFLALNERYQKQNHSFLESGYYINIYREPKDLLEILNAENLHRVKLNKENQINAADKSVALLMADSSKAHEPLKTEITGLLDARGFDVLLSSGQGLKFERELEVINRSTWVVCHFVGSTFPQHQLVNSTAAFFLGYSIAKGKKVVVLQSLPEEKMMVDLAGIVDRFRELSELGNILDKRMNESTFRLLPGSEYKFELEDLRGILKNSPSKTSEDVFESLGGIKLPKNEVQTRESNAGSSGSHAEEQNGDDDDRLELSFVDETGKEGDVILSDILDLDDSKELLLDDDDDLILEDSSAEFDLTPIGEELDEDESGSQVVVLEDTDLYEENLPDDSESDFLNLLSEPDKVMQPKSNESDSPSQESRPFWKRLFTRK